MANIKRPQSITPKKMSITYKPKRKKRKRTHGFRKRKIKKGGQRILKRRRQKKRKRLTA